MIHYPIAPVVIDVDDEPSIEGEIVGIDNSPHLDIAQRKVMCCLALSITILIMVVFGYSLSRS
tara:strand:- start:233 stop:421 length:189 start_codon:yes stop_codon:yes gene_type:complete